MWRNWNPYAFGGTPLQYSCLENPMDGGAWWATVHGVTKSRTQLSDFTFTFHFHALEKEMATHSDVLAWRIPGTGEPGGLPSGVAQSRTWLRRLSSSSSIIWLTLRSNYIHIKHQYYVLVAGFGTWKSHAKDYLVCFPTSSLLLVLTTGWENRSQSQEIRSS